MSECEKQMLINHIAIIEALIAIFHHSGDNYYGVACRNLQLRLNETYELFRVNKENKNE